MPDLCAFGLLREGEGGHAVQRAQALCGLLDAAQKGGGLPDAGLQPYISDAERAGFAVAHRLDAAHQLLAAQYGQRVVAVFALGSGG